MQAKELMNTDVLSVLETESVEDLLEALMGQQIHGAPVVDENGRLVGVVTQQDLFFASATQRPTKKTSEQTPKQLLVGDIMTAPAISAEQDVDVRKLCQTMFELRIHRMPITREGRLAGIVSSLDICAAVSKGADL